jgi:hypothetical protein
VTKPDTLPKVQNEDVQYGHHPDAPCHFWRITIVHETSDLSDLKAILEYMQRDGCTCPIECTLEPLRAFAD